MNRIERLRKEIIQASQERQRLQLQQTPVTDVGSSPTPGDIYVFDIGENVGLEWLVVRAHPDQADLYLVAPLDDCPLIGTPDLVLPEDRIGRLLIVRCGQTEWFPISLLSPRLRVGTLPSDVVTLVKQHLANLVRGRITTTKVPTSDLDPEYEDWITEVARAREGLLARAELKAMLPQPIETKERMPEFVLAAETGISFFESLSRPLVAELAAVADEPLWKTNPAWCIERLRERQPVIADLLQQALPRNNPGVVGLVVDVVNQESFVVPLRVERSSEWYVDPTLPFYPARTLQELLVQLLRSLGLPNLTGVPERFAFTLRDLLGRRSEGPSMHMAGLLALICEANNKPILFERTCCVVQPNGDQLVPVGGIRQKISAFLREYGTGTLLVRCRDNTSAEFDSQFDTVWAVDSLAELARILEQECLLQVFCNGQPLSLIDAKIVAARVHLLAETEHRYAEALDLSLRVERAGFSFEVPNRLQREFRQNIIDMYRHLGSYKKTAELAREECQRVRSSRISSYEDQAHADLTYAAALYAPHRFTEIQELLSPWLARLNTDSLLVTPLTQIKIYNTLGRAWVAIGQDGWENLFKRSEQILQELEPTDLPRTWGYLAQGYLRTGRLSEAETIINNLEETYSVLDEMSRWFLRIYQADLARRQGKTWSDPEMDQATTTTRVGHPFAFYFQATARQSGRKLDDVLNRYRRARDFLRQDGQKDNSENIQSFLVNCLLLAEAAMLGDQKNWYLAISAIESYLIGSGSEGFSNYYKGYIPSKESFPDREAAELLLNRVPFF